MEGIGKIFFLISILTVIHQTSASDMPSVLILSQNSWFTFQSAKKNCMLTDGQNKDNNGKLVMWGECFTNTKNAWWKAVNSPNDPNHFTLQNRDSGLCLSVGTDLTDTGNDVRVKQYACQSSRPATQLWSVDIITDDSHQHWIRLKGSGGRCLSFDPANNEIRGEMYMYDCGCCDRYTNQYFKLDFYGFRD
ncbi:uncharacterized protein LOC119085926 [Bradysia coprophila]|uniref:uncharacterized protein LOC119085926 n=1 Tax=Bradysia coprophila TaxID=38358 RepID=UPI00187DD2E5|nr:uncharacterized protein LOC119085926 [Bradysia coprophila]